MLELVTESEQLRAARVRADQKLIDDSIEFHAKDAEEADELKLKFFGEYDSAWNKAKVQEIKGEGDADMQMRIEEARYKEARKVFNNWRKKYPYDPVEDGGEWADLEGSYKQKSWADAIRNKAFKSAWKGIQLNDEAKIKEANELTTQMRRIKDAGFWIENRDKKEFTLDELKKAIDKVKAHRFAKWDDNSEEFMRVFEKYMETARGEEDGPVLVY